MAELKSLRIQDFRNIEEAELDIKAPFVCFYGDNAQGKTNILEAIYLTANLRSFRSGNHPEWIRSGSKYSHVSALIKDELSTYKIGYHLSRNERRYFIDTNKTAGLKDIITRIRIISYGPNSHELVLGDDGERRRFIDRVVYSIDQKHLDDLIIYNKALKNRNAAIKQNEQYHIWDHIIAKHGSRIVKKRIESINMIREYLVTTFGEFFANRHKIDLEYVPTAGIEESQILDKLIKTAKIDEDQRTTSSGIHRDRIQIYLDGYDAKKVVSTGQAKLISFIFKIAKLRFIREYSKRSPIFLYDDVSSFLDEKRLLQLIGIIKKEDSQIISTTVDNSLFRRLFSDSVQFITVREGRLINDI